MKARRQKYVYGTKGTPTTRALEEAWTDISGAAGTVVVPSGLAAIAIALQSCLKAGDHMLITDSVYRPTRQYADGVLKRFGVETSYYDPVDRCRNRRTDAAEHDGRLHRGTGIPVIRDAGHPGDCRGGSREGRPGRHGQHLGDAPLFPTARAGADIAIEAGTKYLGGHSDLLMGLVTANERRGRR